MGRPPRNSLGSTGSNTTGSNNLASHAIELDSKHRSWLARSLDKNDAEVAALIKLNASLHKLKKEIIERDGGSETKILDAAACIGKLDNGVLFEEEVEKSINEIDRDDELLKDFFLRMKLRRRILNRFARRLNRVSRSMDGETVGVGPPLPPKYGDQPISIDMKKLEEFSHKRKRLEQFSEVNNYHKVLREEKELGIHKTKQKEEEQDSEEPSNPPMKPGETEFIEYDIGHDQIMKQKGSHNDEKDGPEAIKFGAGIGATHRSMSNKEKIAEYTRWENDLLARIPYQPTFGELGMNVIFNEKERRMKPLCKQNEMHVENDSDKELDTDSDADVDADADVDVDADVNTDASEDSEENSNSQQNDKDEDMDVSDTEDEENMGKNANPTIKSQKNKHHTNLDEEMLAEEDSDDTENENTPQTNNANETAIQDANLKDDSKLDSKKNIDTENTKEINSNSKHANNKTTNDFKNKDNSTGPNGSPKKIPSKLKRPIFFSLQAVPSFHNQDLRRIRAIHSDLMESTKKAHIQRRIAEATNEYNQTFRVSSEYNNLFRKLQADAARLLYSARSLSHGKKKDYTVEVAIAKNKWQRRKDIWEQARKKRLEMIQLGISGNLKTRVIVEDIVSTLVEQVGCHAENRHFHFPMHIMGDPIREATAAVISDMKDTIVTHITRESLTYDPHEKFEDFVPPPPEANERMGPLSVEYQMRDAQLRNDMNVCQGKLMKSEEDRKKAWKRMLKIKAEIGGSTRGSMQAMDQLLPSLEGGKMYAPTTQHANYLASHNQHVARRPTQMPSQLNIGIAAKDSGEGKLNMDPVLSKQYTNESIKARIFPDGSIKPVMAPKKLKDGSYQRPAGRKRKGMDWDSVRGVWTPSVNIIEKKTQEDTF